MSVLIRSSFLAFAFCLAMPAVNAQAEGTVVRLHVSDSLSRVKRGTGFVVQGHSYIVTAYHVVQGASFISIDRPHSLAVNDLEVLSVYPDLDIALLKLPLQLSGRVVPFRAVGMGQALKEHASLPVAIIGYGSVLDRLQRYTGYQENAPYVKSQEWNRPRDVPGKSKYLFDLPDVKLIMLQAPTPYGVSGGPVINNAGEVIGVVSGALTRIETVTSLGWAIPIEYALRGNPGHPGRRASEMGNWPPLRLVADQEFYMRAFGGPVRSLLGDLKCPDGIKAIEAAWERTAAASAEFEGYLTSARVSADIGARQARSREDANRILEQQVRLLTERMATLRNGITAYNKEIVVANVKCNRDLVALKDTIDGLPDTPNNKHLKASVSGLAAYVGRNTDAKARQIMNQVEYELQKIWSRIASIGPLSDKGSSFLSRPSKSIESDVHLFTQMVDAMQYAVQTTQSGVYAQVNREIESVLNSYLLFIESTNRQPWDRG